MGLAWIQLTPPHLPTTMTLQALQKNSLGPNMSACTLSRIMLAQQARPADRMTSDA
jgi:hypothetical protein